MKLLVCGGKGQLGSEFAHFSANFNHGTQAPDDSRLQCISLGSSELNICDETAVQAAIEQHQVDALINAAAYTAVDKAESEADKAYAINRDGAAVLARCCAKADIPLLHVSTDYVFSGDKNSPYVESDPVDPQGVYGASKLAGEQAIAEIWHKHIILRVSWVFGRYGNNFVKTMLRLGAEREELGVVADQHGAPTAARSIAENLIRIAHNATQTDQPQWGIYHLPSQPFTHWQGFAENIFDQALELGLLRSRPKVNALSSAEYPTPAKRPLNSRLASEKTLPALVSCDWQSELREVLRELKAASIKSSQASHP